MIGQKKISKKKIILYSIVITIMVLGNIFIYYKNSNITNLNSISDDLITDLSFNSTIKSQTNETKAVIENNLFITLKKIGDWPVIPKKIGKVDPFAPFFTN